MVVHCEQRVSGSFVSLQIIDSIMALFRVDFSGRGELAERQQKLAQMLSRLQKISEGLTQWKSWPQNSVFTCNDLSWFINWTAYVCHPLFMLFLFLLNWLPDTAKQT